VLEPAMREAVRQLVREVLAEEAAAGARAHDEPTGQLQAARRRLTASEDAADTPGSPASQAP
jgi:hypothetical protein